MKRYEEICKGGLVFPLGKKDDCRECARYCSGCIEMAINFGYCSFNEVKHLIQKPDMLNKKYRELFIQYNRKELANA